MATFLELCRAVARESGTLAGGGQSIASVSTAGSGRGEKIVNWTRDAWVNIQQEHGDWLWMRREFEQVIQAGDARYTAADLGVTRYGSWITDATEQDWTDFPFTIQDASLTKADECGISFIPYGLWRSRWQRGEHDPARPTEFSVSPQGELVLGATPDLPYILRGMYVASPQVLTADGDVPEMPAQFHKAIVWEAVKLLSIADEAPISIQTSVGEYARVRDAMTREQRPHSSISFGAGTVIA